MARTERNGLLKSVAFVIAMALAFIAGAGISEAHSPRQHDQLSFEYPGQTHKQSCPLYHHTIEKPCPLYHSSGSSGNAVFAIGKECGGQPAGTSPTLGHGFSNPLMLEAASSHLPSWEAYDFYPASNLYQPFYPGPIEHPPQSI